MESNSIKEMCILRTIIFVLIGIMFFIKNASADILAEIDAQSHCTMNKKGFYLDENDVIAKEVVINKCNRKIQKTISRAGIKLTNEQIREYVKSTRAIPEKFVYQAALEISSLKSQIQEPCNDKCFGIITGILAQAEKNNDLVIKFMDRIENISFEITDPKSNIAYIIDGILANQQNIKQKENIVFIDMSLDGVNIMFYDKNILVKSVIDFDLDQIKDNIYFRIKVVSIRDSKKLDLNLLSRDEFNRAVDLSSNFKDKNLKEIKDKIQNNKIYVSGYPVNLLEKAIEDKDSKLDRIELVNAINEIVDFKYTDQYLSNLSDSEKKDLLVSMIYIFTIMKVLNAESFNIIIPDYSLDGFLINHN